MRFLRLCRIPTASTVAAAGVAPVWLLLPVLLLLAAAVAAASAAVGATAAATVGLRQHVVEFVAFFVCPSEEFVAFFVCLSESLDQKRFAPQ